MTTGHVLLIGGAEDKVRERVILGRFVRLAGGRAARIAVISTASSSGAAAGDLYRRVFTELGADEVTAIHARTRGEANDGPAAAAVAAASGVFLTGGNQLRLASTVGGTRLAAAILAVHAAGATLAGTSAGASAMSGHMLAFGASGASPRQRMAQIAAGLGVLQGIVVDQHFRQRDRLGRLLSVVAQNPGLMGVGIDEDTCADVGPDGILEVVGRRSVTIVDGATSETDAGEVGGHRPIMISDVVLHSLSAGYRFDLRRRTRLPGPVLHALENPRAPSVSARREPAATG